MKTKSWSEEYRNFEEYEVDGIKQYGFVLMTLPTGQEIMIYGPDRWKLTPYIERAQKLALKPETKVVTREVIREVVREVVESTLGAKAYLLRRKGLKWGRIARRLGSRSHNILLLAKHYCKTNGKRWPIQAKV